MQKKALLSSPMLVMPQNRRATILRAPSLRVNSSTWPGQSASGLELPHSRSRSSSGTVRTEKPWTTGA